MQRGSVLLVPAGPHSVAREHRLVVLLGHAAPENHRHGDDEDHGEEHDPGGQRSEVIQELQFLLRHRAC